MLMNDAKFERTNKQTNKHKENGHNDQVDV